MSKVTWNGGTLLSPLPAVLVSVGDMEVSNIITIGWTGIINSDPPMTYISVRPERYSYKLLEKNKEFVINLVSRDLTRKLDLCGVKSGAKVDKFKECHFTKASPSKLKNCPVIEECPVSLECEIVEIKKLGSHDMFIAKILAVDVDEKLINKSGKLDLQKADLVAYSHGEYFALGSRLGKFGYSVRKKK